MNHQTEAERHLEQANSESLIQPALLHTDFATAHGILALIELIQNETEVSEPDGSQIPFEVTDRINELETQARGHILELKGRIHNLETQLDGARAVARNHETTIETQQRIIQRCSALADAWELKPPHPTETYIDAGRKLYRTIQGATNDGKDTNG